jgi:hypothetical protein
MGKGSHVVLKLGDTRTIVRNPKDELKTGTYYAKLKQLGLSDKDRGAAEAPCAATCRVGGGTTPLP